MMAEERGSKKLQANWHKQNVSITEADVEKIARLAESLDLEIFNWHRKGQPAFDTFSTLLHVKHDGLADFIKQYQAIESPFIFVHWFPIGVVQINGYLVNLTTEGGGF